MGTEVTFLNPRTCGIYKNGAPRYKTDPLTGKRTEEIDDELIDAVDNYLAGKQSSGEARVRLEDIFTNKVLVPTYYDERPNEGVNLLLKKLAVDGITIGELVRSGTIYVKGGHGSPGNDQRTGQIPYIKVSDIRGLRVNVNPTNLVTNAVATRLWKGASSGLQSWDVITPNRASNNIGEFAILLPGEEELVLTKEVFVIRILDHDIWDPFYLLWSLSLEAVREQWRRIVLMQTNREDCGDRYREIILPNPRSKDWAHQYSRAFRDYFTTVATAKTKFVESVGNQEFDYIASVRASSTPSEPGLQEPEVSS